MYLKLVLTVIAVSLAIIALDAVGVIPKAIAAPHQTPATQVQYGMVPLNADGSITVKLAPGSELMDVNIKQIDGRGVYTSYIPVDIRAVDGSGIFNGAVPVQQR